MEGPPASICAAILPREKVRLPWISSPLRLLCNSSPVRMNDSLLFPFWSCRLLSSLVIFCGSPSKHGIRIFGHKMATAILWSFSLGVGYRDTRRRRSFDSRLQPDYANTVVVATWMTFYKMSSSSKAQAGGLCTARFELSPWQSTATVAAWGGRCGLNADCRLGFGCPRYRADTCIGVQQYFQALIFIPHRVHSLSDFRLSTIF